MLEGRAKKRDIRLEQYVDDSLLVYGNGDRLYQLVMILGDNAMKYSPDSSVIRFQVMENRQKGTVLTVADQGFGIPEEDIPYIWERFYKADKSHSRHIPGRGWDWPSARKSSGCTRPKSRSRARWARARPL